MVPTKDLRVTTVMEPESSIGSVVSVEIAGRFALVSGGVGRARVLATTDGKKLYKRATPAQWGLRGARMIGDELWMVGEYGRCAVSDDRGESWTDVATPNQECLWDIVRDKKGVLWICGSGATILRGDAKTRKFKLVKHALKPRDNRADPRIELVPAGVLFPLFNALWDGKRFVKPRGLKGAMSAVAIGSTGTIVLAGDKGAGARSTDGGVTFTAVKLGVTNHFNDVAAFAGGFVAVGDKGVMRRSVDDGVTWKPFASGTKLPLWAIGSWGDGAYVGGEQGLVLRLEAPGDAYWKGATDELAPKPVVPATFVPLKPPTPAERDARFAELFGAATAEHEALAAKVEPPRIAADEHDATILAAIDDVDAYRVYGDVLQGRGDPRGELVALQATEGHAKEAAAYIKKHRAELLGKVAGAKGLKLEWRWGFIHRARLESIGELGEAEDDDDEPALLPILESLLAEPSARFLQGLTIGIVTFEENSYGKVIEALGTHALPALRTLFLGDFDSDQTEVSWSKIGDLTKLYPAVGNLEALKLRSGNMKLGRIVLPRLLRLEIETGGLDKVALGAITRADLPSLETLSLFLGTARYGCDLTRRDVMKLLASDRFPRLHRLGICNSEIVDELCMHLHTAPLVAQVRELDLSRGTMSDKGARGLATYAAGFVHLDKLDVSNNYLTKDGIKMLDKALPNAQIIAGKQREQGDYDRYVTLGE